MSVVHKTEATYELASAPYTPARRGVRVASLDAGIDLGASLDGESSTGISFERRFFFDGRSASFDERFAGTEASSGRSRAASAEQPANEVIVVDPVEPGTPPAAEAAPAAAAPSSDSSKQLRVAEAVEGLQDSSSPRDDSRTAIYDISAHTVYLPNGQRLEAHSGLGSRRDDPRFVQAKNRGPTPPNVYDLALRERVFHGVRAIRLIPADERKMYGRDGILAHSYMLGASGQSNGCVAFSNYSAFLSAFMRGEVDRLVVVDRLAGVPRAKTASGWIPEALKNILRRS